MRERTNGDTYNFGRRRGEFSKILIREMSIVPPKKLGELGLRTIAYGQRTPALSDGGRADLRCQKESGDETPHSKGAMAEW